MNRKIAALALGAVIVLTGACGKNEPEATTDSVPEETAPAYKPEDMELVDVPVSKPPADLKVDAAALPTELQGFTTVQGLSEAQQTCINGAMKQAVDADPSLPSTPGKVASLGGGAVAVCDGGAVFTDQILEGLATNETVKLTAAQNTCLKQEFATDKEHTAKFISASMTLNPTAIQDALAPFETKCGVKISQGIAPS
jgi:hypothetical protein